jgi:ribosomal-protein-alanine N-acetyltransferase
MKRQELPETLFSKINIVAPYPNSVKPIEKMLNMTAFFPGGRGLWAEEYSNDFPSILILGQDFSKVEEYNAMLKNNKTDLQCSTWKNLIKLFEEANIDLKKCFYSNVFMGLRDGVTKNTGEFTGFKDKEFVKRNLKFLAIQIEIIKPSLIVTLGRYAAEMLSRIADSGLESWANWRALLDENIGFKDNVSFHDHICRCVALTHASLRHLNVGRRVYINQNGKFYGNSAELHMLKDALVEAELINHYNTLNHVGSKTLITDRLTLRRFANDDSEAVYNNWTSDSEVSKYMRWQPHKNIKETESKINDWVNRYKNNNFYQWAITFKDSDEPIGAIGLFVVNESDMCGDFGYSISRKYWGMGVTTEALKAVLKFSFETVGFNRIESYHSVNNPASGKVMLKVGMKLEGLAKQKYKSNVGFEDSYMYSILKEEFNKLH